MAGLQDALFAALAAEVPPTQPPCARRPQKDGDQAIQQIDDHRIHTSLHPTVDSQLAVGVAPLRSPSRLPLVEVLPTFSGRGMSLFDKRKRRRRALSALFVQPLGCEAGQFDVVLDAHFPQDGHALLPSGLDRDGPGDRDFFKALAGNEQVEDFPLAPG